MSVSHSLNTETDTASTALVPRSLKAVTPESKWRVSASRRTLVSEKSEHENDFIELVSQVSLLQSAFQTANPPRQYEYVICPEQFPNDTLIEKETVSPKSELELSTNSLISKLLCDISNSFKEIEGSLYSRMKLTESSENFYQNSYTSINTPEFVAQHNIMNQFLHFKSAKTFIHELAKMDDVRLADNIAKELRPRLEESPALEAAIAFPDMDLLQRLSQEELAELEIDGPDDFSLFVVTEKEGCHSDLFDDFIPVLEWADKHGWFPSINIISPTRAKEAGGLEKLAENWSPRVHSIFYRKPIAS